MDLPLEKLSKITSASLTISTILRKHKYHQILQRRAVPSEKGDLQTLLQSV